jgi:hypothetical protein
VPRAGDADDEAYASLLRDPRTRPGLIVRPNDKVSGGIFYRICSRAPFAQSHRPQSRGASCCNGPKARSTESAHRDNYPQIQNNAKLTELRVKSCTFVYLPGAIRLWRFRFDKVLAWGATIAKCIESTWKRPGDAAMTGYPLVQFDTDPGQAAAPARKSSIERKSPCPPRAGCATSRSFGFAPPNLATSSGRAQTRGAPRTTGTAGSREPQPGSRSVHSARFR